MTATTNYILQYLEMFTKMMDGSTRPPGFRYQSEYHFLLEKAKAMPGPAVLSSRRGPMKQCYATSAKYVMMQRGDPRAHDLVYCCGYAIPDGLFPMKHAWILDISPGARRVIETTWDKPGLEYRGIAFSTGFLRESMKARKYAGLIDNWEHNYPLLRMNDEEISNAFHPVMEIL